MVEFVRCDQDGGTLLEQCWGERPPGGELNCRGLVMPLTF